MCDKTLLHRKYMTSMVMEQYIQIGQPPDCVL